MGRAPSLTVAMGQRFGRLVVRDADCRYGKRGDRGARCRCDCGAERVVALSDLLRGKTTSCGCARRDRAREWCRSGAMHDALREALKSPENRERLRRQADQMAQAHVTHGLASHPLYGTHARMMARCYREDSPDYQNYGARGITADPEWHDVRQFIAWIEANLGPRPDGMTLDRVDNDGPYAPGNVQWASAAQQRRNQRRMAPATARPQTRHLAQDVPAASTAGVLVPQ